jgi:hypothetical protein
MQIILSPYYYILKLCSIFLYLESDKIQIIGTVHKKLMRKSITSVFSHFGSTLTNEKNIVVLEWVGY